MSNKNKIGFIDDNIYSIENDIERIQVKPGMYISYLGSRGAVHLAKEDINNHIDECENDNSPGNEITIFIDEVDDTITTLDNGRGINFDQLEEVCTIMHSGSKFTRSNKKGSAGENGVGMTAINALSEEFILTSYRGDEKLVLTFNEGKKVDSKKSKTKKFKTGLSVKFKPSKKFLGKDTFIDYMAIEEWLEKIQHLIPKDIMINFSVNRKGKESTINKKFRNKNGLIDFLNKHMLSKSIITPISISEEMNVKIIESIDHSITNAPEEHMIKIDVALGYNPKGGDIKVESFCNYINTVEHGVHVDGVRQAILQYMSKMTKDSLSDKESKTLDINFADASKGLTMALSLYTSMSPHFASQTKEKLTNQEFYKPIRKMVYDALDKYFRHNQKELKKMTDYVKAQAKLRTESNKLRDSLINSKSTVSGFDTDLPKSKFHESNAKGKNEYREFIIFEGESALGQGSQACYKDFQALFGLKGVPKNTYDLDINSTLKNDEFRFMVKELRAGIGEKFNINNLWYDKIIIQTDADLDGLRIRSLLCAFFLIHMPDVIRHGKLYIGVSPLYKIDDKNNPFVHDMKEYIERHEKKITQNLSLVDIDTDVVMKPRDVGEFLLKNRDYLDELMRLATHFAIDPSIIELIAMYYENDRKTFDKKLKNKFPEMTVEDSILSGIHEGRYQTIVLDKILFKKLANIIDILNANDKYYYKVIELDKGKPVNEIGNLSIGEFLLIGEKYRPRIITRFKGIGELNEDDLKKTTFDPANRLLLRMTMKDVKEEVDRFRILHGDKGLEERKELMSKFKLRREYLEN